MSATAEIQPPQILLTPLPYDQERGVQAMWALVATELMLFVCMFGAYYYLGANKSRWQFEQPPKLFFPLLLLVVLLLSSVVLRWGEERVKAGEFLRGRIALWITVVLGFIFLGLQVMEYSSHLNELAPSSDSYGSIFYALTSLHAVHLVVGLLLLMYVGILPRYANTRRTPHNAYKTVAIYWHFVDVVWIFIVALLYVAPHLVRPHAS